jgi:SAM-dependent methyltransferase
MDSHLPEYELYAIRYAERDARRADHFIGGDSHDGPMPMDCFVWAAIGPERSFVIDTGFTAEVAAARGRRHLRCPAESLALIGLDHNSVADVILTHMHYDHVGTVPVGCTVSHRSSRTRQRPLTKRRMPLPLATRRLFADARQAPLLGTRRRKEMPYNPVETHYTRPDLGEVILAALKAAGKDLDQLTPDDLAPVDEFHGGQRPATIRLAGLVGFTGNERVLDVGSGLGGPSRYLAWHYGCRVSGVDLTTEFVRIAETLTQLTGLVGRVVYRQGSALALPFEDMCFDVVWSQNVAMNIADRERLYREMHRVLRPGGKLALQEVAAGPGGLPHYPVQWARTPGISFLYSQQATRATLEATGFRVLVWQDTTEAALASAVARAGNAVGPPPVLGTHLILGADWQAMFRNSARNLEERRTELFNAVLERGD